MKITKVLCSLMLAAAFILPASFAQAELLNVNTATEEQLVAVPGMTPDIAKGIISYRNDMGDIQNLDELTEVPGISKDLLGKLKEFIGLDAISGAECSC